MQDSLGTTLNVGDKVLYANAGGYSPLNIAAAVVVKIDKSSARHGKEFVTVKKKCNYGASTAVLRSGRALVVLDTTQINANSALKSQFDALDRVI